jgi:DNA-binding CsgD family transcriptional regulator/tetratricopeptide (TPR) repeat protein
MATGGQDPEHASRASAFVGRAAELSRLTRLLAKAADGAPATLLVRGEVGVGKSRLLREFADQARQAGAQVLWGACIALGTGELPYAPLIDALRRLVRGAGPDQMAEIAGAGYAELASLVSDLTHAGEDPAAAPVTGRGAQSRVFAAVLDLLDQLGADRPVVLVMEDLQWADPSTLDLFGYLARARTSERLLLVGSYRTTHLPPRHQLRTLVLELDLARLIQQLEVVRFARGELRQFLRNAMHGEASYDLAERAFELTDGNALFLEEVLTAGVLTTVPGSSDPVALPGTISELVLPRFELLGADAREVMRVAATAGRRVSHRLLAAVCEMPERQLLTALRECVNSQMLVGGAVDDTYVFRHALLREVVHQNLIPGDRLRLHRAIATALEADSDLSYAEQVTVAAELSYHWYEARAYPQALPAAVRAGSDAMRLLAFREAERQFDRALAIWDRLSDAPRLADIPKYRLLSLAADAARWAGRVDQAIELTRAATSEVDPIRQPVLAGEFYERLGSYLWERGDHSAAERAYTEAGLLLADAPASSAAARVLAVQATAHIRHGRPAQGLGLGQEALAMARSVGAKAEEGRALNAIGTALTLLDRVEEGIATLSEALRIADAGSQLEDLYRAYGNLVFALEYAGELDRAVAVAVEGLDRARETGLEHTRGRAVLANNACASLVLLGKWDEATGIIKQLLEDHPAAERLFPCLTMVEIMMARGQFEAADQIMAEVREAGAWVGQPQFVGSWYACEAEIAIWRRQPDLARVAVADGLRTLAGSDDLVVALRLCALGLRNEADEWLRVSALPATARAGLSAGSTAGDSLAVKVDRLARAGEHSRLPEVAALLRLCRAEQSRTGTVDQAPGWVEVAAGWERLKRPYQTAYARWRQAEAAARNGMAARRPANRKTREDMAAQARDAAREAHRLATQLRAEPLLAEIEALVRSARIDLAAGQPDSRGTPTQAPATDSFGLTQREREVLALVCAGWSNRKIARKLFITEKTAGVHVSNILRKLQVPGRGEAAAVANRLNLLDQPTAE